LFLLTAADAAGASMIWGVSPSRVRAYRRPPRATLTDTFGAAALDGYSTAFMLNG
jgi:hypothetical protein